MSWFRQLDNHRGSQPRCVLMVKGNREEVASRLTRMVNLPDVVVSLSDRWMPYGKPVRRNGSWDKTPAQEVELDKSNDLVCREVQLQLKTWWLAVPGRGKGTRTPNWDIASTCTIMDKPGLLLIEAKAHSNELDPDGKLLRSNASPNSIKNHERIGLEIAEAAAQFQQATGKRWDISRDHHSQLSNRFAWSWKLASLGIPVVLVYLGFLNAQDMVDGGPLFRSEAEWTSTLKDHCLGAVDEACWGEWVDFDGVPFIALIRGIDQPFDSNDEDVGA